MAQRILALIAAASLAIAGCQEPTSPWRYPTSPVTTRPATVPASDALTLPTQTDIGMAAQAASDQSITKAVTDYLGSGAPRWNIVAARDIGDYVLLWLGFPEIADGGIDLVYSKPDQRVKWQFKGGERG